MEIYPCYINGVEKGWDNGEVFPYIAPIMGKSEIAHVAYRMLSAVVRIFSRGANF